MVSLEEKIKDLISREDPICPLSDEQLSQMLSVSRVSVTLTRDRLGIPNSRARRKAAIAKLVSEEAVLQRSSLREVSRVLAKKGVKVSHSTVGGILKSSNPGAVVSGSGTRTSKGSPAPKDQADIHQVFQTLVGTEGSLRPVVQLAQAAVMYPPHGLNTLILGPTGVGKTELAMAMYRYAVEIGTIPSDGPFVSMNCADYADNPQLLMSHLFGHTKGAFTGATEEKPGLVELANRGILFLDEIHRLPPQGQEMLFSIIDKGTFRRLGESESERRTSFLLIAATSSDPDVALLDAMRRRLPVVIRIPPLSARPIAERLEMIKRFFSAEAAKVNAPIEVSSGVVEALLKYECPGNVGQLKADIQVACARGYLKFTTGKRSKVSVTLDDLPAYAARGLIESRSGPLSFSSYLGKNMIFEPGEGPHHQGFVQDDYAFPDNLYEWMETRFDELAASGLSAAQRTKVMASELERMIAMQLRSVHARGETLQALEISDVADPRIYEAVDAAIASEFPEISGDRTLIACIAIHLTASLERMKQGRSTVNPGELLSSTFIPEDIREKSRVVLRKVEDEIESRFPEYEADFIAMYVTSRQDRAGYSTQKVGIVLMSHGRVASAVKDVVDVLLPGLQIDTVEIDLREDLKNAFARAKEVVRQADRGFGVLAIADMGSLVSLGGMVSESTGIRIHTLGPLTTVLVLDAARRAMAGASLDEIVDGIALDMDSLAGWHKANEAKPKDSSSRSIETPTPVISKSIGHSRPVILLTCVTGRGVAQKLKETLEKIYPSILELADLIPCSVSSARDIANDARSARVVAAIGPVDPGISGIPFISARDFLTPYGQLRLRVQIERVLHPARPSLKDLIDLDLVFLDEDIKSSPGTTAYGDVIRRLAKPLEVRGLVGKNFVDSCLKRESWDPTVLGNGIAIPHGLPEEVYVPKIVCARLKNACNWAGYEVRLVFLMAVTENCADALNNLLKTLEDAAVRNQLLTVETKEVFLQVLLDTVKMAETV